MQAYLQSKHHITRKIYIKAKDKYLKTCGIDADLLLELNKSLYRLCGAGDY